MTKYFKYYKYFFSCKDRRSLCTLDADNEDAARALIHKMVSKNPDLFWGDLEEVSKEFVLSQINNPENTIERVDSNTGDHE